MALELDESRFPLVVVRMTDALTDDDVRAFMDGGVRWIGRMRPYGLVIIAEKVALPRIDQIKPLVKWMNEHAEGLDTYHRVIAVVTASPMLRGAMKAIFKLRRLYAEQYVSESETDAVAWADARLREMEPEI